MVVGPGIELFKHWNAHITNQRLINISVIRDLCSPFNTMCILDMGSLNEKLGSLDGFSRK